MSLSETIHDWRDRTVSYQRTDFYVIQDKKSAMQFKRITVQQLQDNCIQMLDSIF